MKSKEQLYQEAIERNVHRSLGKEKYATKNTSPAARSDGMTYIKSCLGIRQNDSKYDIEIKSRIGGD